MKTAKEIIVHHLSQNEVGHDIYFINSGPKVYGAVEDAMEAYANQYKNLLKKYIQHVKACEGVDFTDHWVRNSEVYFTNEEIKLLKELAGNPWC